ncbi:MAG: DUF4384 domain-containing protein [Candidatus Latescibacterota bacterium]|nr:MAG: DUF4384 domain-containing protein [Candidatus Latescibacterota bacterium]
MLVRGLATIVLFVIVFGGLFFAPWLFAPRLEVQTELYVQDAAGHRRVEQGAAVHPDDLLSLLVHGTKEMHVYVFAEDADGVFAVLFPTRGGLTNPLAANRSHRLPAESSRWLVTSAGGTETILVVASHYPLDDLEREIEALPRVRPDGDERGIQGIVDAPEQSGEILPRIARRYSERAARERDLCVWELEFENQGEQ